MARDPIKYQSSMVKDSAINQAKLIPWVSVCLLGRCLSFFFQTEPVLCSRFLLQKCTTTNGSDVLFGDRFTLYIPV